MKKLIVVICTICLILAPMSVMAKNSGKGKGKGKGPNPNESAYEHASDNAKFKRGDDWQGGNGKDEDGDLPPARPEGPQEHIRFSDILHQFQDPENPENPENSGSRS